MRAGHYHVIPNLPRMRSVGSEVAGSYGLGTRKPSPGWAGKSNEIRWLKKDLSNLFASKRPRWTVLGILQKRGLHRVTRRKCRANWGGEFLATRLCQSLTKARRNQFHDPKFPHSKIPTVARKIISWKLLDDHGAWILYFVMISVIVYFCEVYDEEHIKLYMIAFVTMNYLCMFY